MSNYCFNKVIIKYDDYKKYLEDYYPYGSTEKHDKPFITFCKFMGDDYSEAVDSAEGWFITDLKNGYMDVRFQTRGFFPIKSAIKLLGLAKDTVWFMTEEGDACVTRLSIENGEIVEDIYVHDVDDYDEFQCFHWGLDDGKESELEKNMHSADDLIWYYFIGDETWYRIKKRNLVNAYASSIYVFSDFYDKTIQYNRERKQYQVIKELIDYEHTLADNSWQIESSPIHLINVFKCHEK